MTNVFYQPVYDLLLVAILVIINANGIYKITIVSKNNFIGFGACESIDNSQYFLSIFQNSTCKSLPWNQAPETETKHSIWSRGFVRLLKKKKLTSHNSSGNNNNDAENHSRYPSSKDNGNTNNTNNTNNSNNTNNTKVTSNTINLVNNTRNGHARAIPPCTLDIPVTSVDIKWSPAKVVQNNIKASVETGKSTYELTVKTIIR